MRSEFQLGQTIAGQYVVVDELGRGGFGVVYLAVQESVQRYVAVKVLQPKIAAAMGEPLIAAFRREALHMSRLHNAHTVTLFDYGETPDGVLYLVTELLDGEPLGAMVTREGPQGIQRAVHILKQVAVSLTEAHGIGLVHGDLTPENIFLLAQPGNDTFVKVLDFGIARVIGSAEMAGAGNPQYMAPEQFDGGPALPASDIYAAGLVLFEVLTGKPLFSDFNARIQARQSPPAVRGQLPRALGTSQIGDLIETLTHPDPLARCPSGMVLLGELEQLESRYTVSLDPQESLVHAEMTVRTTQPMPKLSRVSAKRPPDVWGAPPSDALLAVSSGQDSVVRLVGRTREKSTLLCALDAVRTGECGRVVLLGGGKGIGKSSLMRWFRREVGMTREFSVGWASCGLGSSGSALVRAVGDAFGLRGVGRESPALGSSIADAVGRWLGDADRQEFMDQHGWIFAPGVHLESALGELVVAVAELRPLVLLIDELEQGSMADLRALDAVAGRIDLELSPVLVVCGLCRDALPGKPDLARGLMEMAANHDCFDQVFVGALDGSDEVLLVRATLQNRLGPSEQVSPELVSVIVRRSHGHPAVIAELVDYLVDGDLLATGPHGLVLSSQVDSERLMAPTMRDSMSGWLGERLGRHLNHADLQLVLSRCAVLGARFSESLLTDFLRAEADSGHLCARRCSILLGELLWTLVEEDVLMVEAGEGSRAWSFCQPFMHQYLADLSDRGVNAAAVHRLAAEVKDKAYAAAGASPHQMAEARAHLDRAQSSNSGGEIDQWDIHRVCWQQSAPGSGLRK